MNNAEKLTVTFLERAPAAAADELQRMPVDDAAQLLEAIPARLAAPVVNGMIPWQAARLLETVPAARAAMILRQLAFFDSISLARLMRPEYRERLVEELPTRYARRLTNALRYPQHQVGAWIDPEVPTLNVEATVADAQRVLRAAEPASHVFVESADRSTYIGSVTVQVVMRADLARRLEQLELDAARPISSRAPLASVNFDERWDECLHLPVIGRRGNLLGGLSRKTLRESLHEQHVMQRTAERSIAHHLFAALLVTVAGMLKLISESMRTVAASSDGVEANER
jgi:Mg/Co/Ni transporter MgtE